MPVSRKVWVDFAAVSHAARSATLLRAAISALDAPAIGPICTPISLWMRRAKTMLGALTPRDIWLA